MNATSTYQKVASYEAKKGEVKKALLLYSGGLDTSVILKWIQDEYEVPVIALTIDLGQQHDDLAAIQAKALKLGAAKAVVVDAKDEFANDYLAKGMKANASYQGDYHLSTPMGRAVMAKIAVEVAARERADCIAHGCTGKGNDQVRLDGYILALAPTMKVMAPVREWNMDRNEEILYAQQHGIPVPAHVDFPYSVDDNMWGMTWEGGEIEDPALVVPVEKFLTHYTLPEQAPSEPEIVRLKFSRGIPVELNGKVLTLAPLIAELNDIAGAHGVGVVHLVEDRIVGLKNRGVYEQPAAHVIVSAHRALERYTSTRALNELKEALDIKWGYLCYGAQWHDPAMDAINAFNDAVNARVSGEVTLKLFKGHVTVVAMNSPFALARASFQTREGYRLNVNASAGFIEHYSLAMRLAKHPGQ